MSAPRVVLVAPHRNRGDIIGGARLSRMLDWLAVSGWDLVAMVEPDNARTAHRMVADDQADVIMAMTSRDLPSMVLIADVPRVQHVVTPDEVARSSDNARRSRSMRQRRPQRVDGRDD